MSCHFLFDLVWNSIKNIYINKANKVPFIKRKTASPYHSPKKKEKNVINYDLIKKLEDEELIKFQWLIL